MDTKTITIRMPCDLARTIEQIAAVEDRSINQQLVRLVREWLSDRKYYSETKPE